MFKRIKIVVVAILLSLISTAIIAQTPAAANPAEQRAREIAGYITSGNRAEFRRYVEANFSGDLLGMPMELHLGFLSSMHDSSRGFEVHSVQDTKPNEVTMLVKNRLTGEWDGFFVRVEPAAPYKVSGLGLRPAKPPVAEAKKLSEKDVTRELDSFVKKLADADVFSGTVLLAKDGKVLYTSAFGMANKDFKVPNKIDTKFNLGSMNKMFTGLAIAQLVEKEKLSFDDPLSKFIPDFPNAEDAQKIKIKHLLTHTAGLGGYFSRRYQESSRASLRTVDDMMNLVRQDEKSLQFAPGSKWKYSNTGMLVLGKVIEIVSGQSYYDYVREHIYKPAGMTNTDSYELDKVNTNLAVGYDKQFTDNGITWSNNVFEHVMRGGPHGGGYSTVEDLLRFDQAFRSGKLVGQKYVKILTTPKPELNSPKYGYGFSASADSPSTGHSGGFTGINSSLNMYLGSGWTAVVLSNYSRSAQPIAQKMQSLIAATNR